jgi:phosphatidylcholine synthase
MRRHTQAHLLPAVLVHLLTASGAVFGLLALLAVAQGAYELCFAWLGAALVVDGADGPLARRYDVKTVLPRFSGEDLDKVIDYLTYVTVPAFIVAGGAIVGGALSYVAAALIMLSSLYHFSDTQSKTQDGYFIGFPAIWNLVVFYLLAVPVPPEAAFAVIVICTLLTFVPLKWVHPVRVKRWRPVTFALMALWAVAACLALWEGFPAPAEVQGVLCVTLAYALVLGLTAGRPETVRRPAE